MRHVLLFLTFLFGSLGFAQETPNRRVEKKVAFTQEIIVDSTSITPFDFKIFDKQLKRIDTSLYKIDFSTSRLVFTTTDSIASDSIYIHYTKYPQFLTKKYYQFDKSIIVENTTNTEKLYALGKSTTTNTFTPFSGLETSGSISRGIAIGNSQNTVLNSELDLQISGKISENISLRASLQDANIPLQEGGYSQRLDEFDQVFVELYSKNWRLRAGDVNLKNSTSYFGRFTKKVQGIFGAATINGEESTSEIFASGALVRGQYTRSTITGQEGNQGPYKLTGPNGQLFVLIVSGSETVYVNGLRLQRGENKDYVIDYNAGEITFNATYPITSEMRIIVEYQFSDRNYSRIIAYGGGGHENDTFSIKAHVYTENDAKNQPLQQNLGQDQVTILQTAGDDQNLMNAPSAVPEAYSENKILYKKEIIGGVEVFVFSNTPTDELYQVSFSFVGANQGNYMVSNSNAISNIYQYTAPVGGVLQGSYEPIVRLAAPTKLQMAVIDAAYVPNDKTAIEFELAGSRNDLNLFSSIDDENNNGFAGKFKVNRTLVKRDSSWNLNTFVDIDHLDKNFRTIERLYNIEFNRDWNLQTPLGHQNIIRTGITTNHHKKGVINYAFEHLSYSENYNGNRHVLNGNLRLNRLLLSANSSYMTSNSSQFQSSFLRASAKALYQLKKGWIGAKTNLENNQLTDKATNTLTNTSQKFNGYETFYGIGDSTRIFGEIGYKYRVNDSVRSGQLERVNSSNTYYLKSRILSNKKSTLSVHGNYRTLHYTDPNIENEKNLNTRILYSQRLFDRIMRLNTSFEINSGVVPQQAFTYVKVDEGQGIYTWNDYNGNSIQELNEFEIAPFPDQANYIKVLLPNQIFIKTAQNKWSFALVTDLRKWEKSTSGAQRFLAKFYNQTSFLIDKKTRRENTLNFNLFDGSGPNLITQNSSFKNTLFYQRGKQRYTTSYTFVSNNSKNLLSIGFQENMSMMHQLQFIHKMKDSWIFDWKNGLENTENKSENFSTNNYEIGGFNTYPKLSYLASSNTKFDVFYQFSYKQNNIGNLEELGQQRFGLSFAIANREKISLNGEFNYYVNDFAGNSFSPVAYQMLNGLEKGKNLTWSLFAQKRITKFLDLNFSYFGRKTETSPVIHTGNIQLKAFF